jgi:hypothetical protein
MTLYNQAKYLAKKLKSKAPMLLTLCDQPM